MFLSFFPDDKSAGRQWYKMRNRMMTDLHHRCTLRTAPEEFNLSANQHVHGPTAAEYIRSYMAQSFPGLRLVHTLEAEMKSDAQRFRRGLLPVRKDPVQGQAITTYHFEDSFMYGCAHVTRAAQ